MSLRNRVTLSTVAILGAGLAIISITLNLLLVGRLSADASTLLANRADAQVSTLLVRNGTVKVRENPDDASLDAHAWIFDADGNALERSPVYAAIRQWRAGGVLHGRGPGADERITVGRRPGHDAE